MQNDVTMNHIDENAKKSVREHIREIYSLVSSINATRSEIWHPTGLSGWSLLEWSGAMCGEAGEAANVAKKIRRVDSNIASSKNKPRKELIEELKREIGDTYLYLDLLAQAADLNMYECIRAAFNDVSAREGFPHKLP